MKHQRIKGFLFILPWLVGFLTFTLIPMLAAVYIGFTDWNTLSTPNFVGIANYKELFTDANNDFYYSLWVTVRFALLAIPLTIITSLVISIFLSKNRKGVGVYRVIYYMPAIVSGVAVAVVFKWILDPNVGLINGFLKIFGIKGPGWLTDPNWVLPSYLILAIWGAGGGILTYLAAIKDVPMSLYESAEIDGANSFQKTIHITVPMLTPIIFYNLVMGIISSFRKFSDAYILEGGREGTFYMVSLYTNAFQKGKMGLATAQAWILFVIILSLTLFVNYSKKFWVQRG